jgi:outer membrane protein assembly factor BamB
MIITPTRAFILSDTDLTAIDRVRHDELSRRKRSLEDRRGRITKALEIADKTKEADAEAVTQLRAELDRVGASIEETKNGMAAASLWSTTRLSSSADDGALSMILAGETLFLGRRGHGNIVAVSTENGERIWEASVNGRVWGLAVANGRLLVSTDEGRIHAFEPVATTARGNDATDSEGSEPSEKSEEVLR